MVLDVAPQLRCAREEGAMPLGPVLLELLLRAVLRMLDGSRDDLDHHASHVLVSMKRSIWRVSIPFTFAAATTRPGLWVTGMWKASSSRKSLSLEYSALRFPASASVATVLTISVY